MIFLKRNNLYFKIRIFVIYFIPYNIKDYDVIYLGYPNYWGTMPMAMFTFLENVNLENKVIKPFCSHEGSGFGRSIGDIKRICPKAQVEKGIDIHKIKDYRKKDLLEKIVEVMLNGRK